MPISIHSQLHRNRRTNKARLVNRWGCCVGHALRNFNPPFRFDAHPRPRVLLGICALRVQRHIPLKQRVTANCVQFVNQLVAAGTPTTFAEHVRKRRLELKLSQKQLAKVLDTTHDTISSWELGQSKPQTKYRARVVNWLGFDPDTPTA